MILRCAFAAARAVGDHDAEEVRGVPRAVGDEMRGATDGVANVDQERQRDRRRISLGLRLDERQELAEHTDARDLAERRWARWLAGLRGRRFRGCWLVRPPSVGRVDALGD